MPKLHEAENVQCKICFATKDIKESELCQCGNRLFTTLELRLQIEELDRQAFQLRQKAMSLQNELFLRERRRTLTDVKGNRIVGDVFWEGVHGVPRDMKPAAKAAQRKVEISAKQLAEYD